MNVSYDHRQNKWFAFIGMLGGLLCSVADYFLEYLGQASVTLGSYGVTESAWQSMASWRFSASIWIACIAVPMYVLAFVAITRQMRATNGKLGTAFGVSTFIGSMGALFIHVVLCLMPVVYNFLTTYDNQGIAVATVDAMTASFIAPFYAYYALLIVIPLILWCVYCFQKNALYRPCAAIAVVGFTAVCIALGKLIPAVEWLTVGAVSRMIALWGFIAWQAERHC